MKHHLYSLTQDAPVNTTPIAPAASWTLSSPRSLGFWKDEHMKRLRDRRGLLRDQSVTFATENEQNNLSPCIIESASPTENKATKENDPPDIIVKRDGFVSPKCFIYPTWSLLGRNSQSKLMSGPEGIGRNVVDLDATTRASKRCVITEHGRSHSQPPINKSAKIAQRSSHGKLAYAGRRCRSIGRMRGITANNNLRPRRTRGDDFLSLELIGISANDASFSQEEKKACNDLCRQDTRRLGLMSKMKNQRSPMDHPYFIWPLLTDNQSLLSRIKLLNILAAEQIKNTNCKSFHSKKTRGLTLLQGGHSIARLGKAKNEDAICIPSQAPYTHVAGGYFVVADGVGEWSDYGLDSSLFSSMIANETGSHLTQQCSLSLSDESLKCVLGDALRTSFDKATETWTFGASTVMAGILSPEGSKVHTANVGDCALIQLRRDPMRRMRMIVVKKSITTQHEFNTPKQLLNCPGEEHYEGMIASGQEETVQLIKGVREKAQKHGQEIITDDPHSAAFTEFTLLEGDLLLCASDGLFDNLFDDEIAQMCSYAISPYEASIVHHISCTHPDNGDDPRFGERLGTEWLKGRLAHPNAMEPPQFILDPRTNEKSYYTDPSKIARGLVEAAYARGLDPIANVPFGRAARRAGFIEMATGGKADDTTCVAMWVAIN